MNRRDGVYFREDCGKWWVSFTNENGLRVRRPAVASTRTQAVEVLQMLKTKMQREHLLGVKEQSDIATEKLFERYEKHQSGLKSLERTKQILGRWLDALPVLAKEITSEQIDRQVTVRREDGAAAATINKEITVLKHCLRLAVKWKLLHTNAAQDVERPKVMEGLPSYLTPGNLKAALHAAPEWMRAPIALAAVTGCRRGELYGLQWCDVNLEKRQLYLPETKNGEFRVVPINKLALQVLGSLLTEKAGFVLSPDVTGTERQELKARLSVETRRLFKRLGIKDASFHTLRHTAASWAVMGGESLYSVGQLLGHKTPRMTKRYAHLSPEHLQGTAAKLDTAFAGVLPAGDVW